MNPPSSPSPQENQGQPRGGLFRAPFLYARGLIVDQHARHAAMFYAVLIPMLMVFVGYEFLWGWMEPHQHFYRFAVYWMICGALAILAALLAVYELLILHLQNRLARRALRAKLLREEAAARENRPE